nr:hypothetical protein AVEN_273061-1 [Araneus ventricosus]
MEVARGLVSVSIASRVMAINNSHVRGSGSGQTASVHPFTRALPRDLPSHAPLERHDWSEFHRPQSTSRNLEVLSSLGIAIRKTGSGTPADLASLDVYRIRHQFAGSDNRIW